MLGERHKARVNQPSCRNKNKRIHAAWEQSDSFLKGLMFGSQLPLTQVRSVCVQGSLKMNRMNTSELLETPNLPNTQRRLEQIAEWIEKAGVEVYEHQCYSGWCSIVVSLEQWKNIQKAILKRDKEKQQGSYRMNDRPVSSIARHTSLDPDRNFRVELTFDKETEQARARLLFIEDKTHDVHDWFKRKLKEAAVHLNQGE
jgi:hypothetical protein